MFKTRQYFIFFILILILFFLFARLAYLQVINRKKFSELASDQHNSIIKVEPRRGTIYDRFMEPLAINLDVPSIYADPRSIHDKKYVSDKLSGILNMNSSVLLERLQKDKAFVWVKRKVSAQEAEKVRVLKLEGVNFVTESKRHYPNDSMACHVIGFAGIDNEGLEGLELSLNDELKGQHGWRSLVRDAKRRTVLFNERECVPPQDGYNVILTIDSVIQYIVEEEIKAMAEKYNASSASCVVMEPSTGRILALCNYPGFDLNSFGQVPKEGVKNDPVSSVFEPGSVFKVVTAGASLNEIAVDPEEEFDCENGTYNVGGRILHDYHPYGILSFKEVISKSSNIGTVKAAYKLGDKKLYEYIRKFGFGEKTGIDLPGEVEGIVRPPSTWSRSDMTTIPIGQGIAVTTIQLACTASTIANGGLLMKPYIIDKITTWENETFRKNGSELKRRVLDEVTCNRMKNIMHEVVLNGTGRRAASKIYEFCGKTGTAQAVDPNGGYYPNKYNATFIGFAPKERPLVSIVVTAYDPHPVHFGGSVAGPAFKRIAERTLQYLKTNVPIAEHADN